MSEQDKKNGVKATGMQLTGAVTVLIGLALHLAVSPVIGLPLLFIGLILNVIALAKKPRPVKDIKPEK